MTFVYAFILLIPMALVAGVYKIEDTVGMVLALVLLGIGAHASVRLYFLGRNKLRDLETVPGTKKEETVARILMYFGIADVFIFTAIVTWLRMDGFFVL